MLIRSTLLIFFLGVATACTNSEQEAKEPTDEQSSDEGESAGNGGDDGAGQLTAETPAEPSVPADNEVLTNDTPSAPLENVPADQTAPTNSAPVAQDTAPAVQAPAPVSGRVVRYAENDISVLSGPNAGDSQVSMLKKGDSVLIEDLGAFGKIAECKFVAKEALSEAVVPRDSTSNPWK